MKKTVILLIILMISSVLPTGCAVSSQEVETAITQTTVSTTSVQTSSSETTRSTSTKTTASESVMTEPVTSTTRQETTAVTTQTAATTGSQTEKKSVTISISCLIASQNDLPGTPEDGWILTERMVFIDDGDSVFDILKRVTDEAQILLMTRRTANAVFVSAIAGITAVNAKSGWMFSVNDEFPMISSSLYKLNDGDEIKWQYTMDSGEDL